MKRVLEYNKAMKQVFESKGVLQTEAIAEEFAKTLKGGDVVLLKGEMGAGKTHFTKGIAKGLGICDVITSPTFAIHNVYDGKLTLNHFDFYRIEDSSEAEMLGLDEFFYDKNAVSVIEWSENVQELLPEKRIEVIIRKISENARSIEIENK